jgi:phosphatidylglycerol---prolipoprotein diacylglyceryl transferase
MRQVLFRIPVEFIASWFPDSFHFKAIADECPDAPPFFYLALALAAIGAGIHFERRRKQEGWTTWLNFGVVGGFIAAFFGLVWAIKAERIKDAPNFMYPLLAFTALVAGNLLERRRNEAGWKTRINFHYTGIIVAIVLGIIWGAKVVSGFTPTVPIFGYGAMLFLAFIACTLLADRLATRDGMAGVHVQDLAIWIFIMGIVGARLTFMIQYRHQFTWDWTIIRQFFQVWDGGLVFYGSVPGGLVGYIMAYFFVLRRHSVDSWKMADVIAPCVALGLCLGRVGCLLNGCCFGNVATCPDCPEIHFGLSSPPRYYMVGHGYQTPAGFLTRADGRGDNREVSFIEPDSAAAAAGLKVGDIIEKINGKEVGRQGDLEIGDLNAHFGGGLWPHGQSDVNLTVARGGEEKTLTIAARTIGLHPTQIYESISMLLVFFLLLAFIPFRAQPGAVMVLFMFCYAVHRFFNEMLRTDTDPVALGMTLSQNVSILVFGLAVVLALYLRIKYVRARAGFSPPPIPEFTPAPASGSEHLLSGKPALQDSAKRDESIRK